MLALFRVSFLANCWEQQYRLNENYIYYYWKLLTGLKIVRFCYYAKLVIFRALNDQFKMNYTNYLTNGLIYITYVLFALFQCAAEGETWYCK